MTQNGIVTRARGVFYGWRLVALAGFMMTLMSLTVFQGIGTFFVTLERHFNWSRTQLSGAFTLARAEGAIVGPLEGYLVDRLGPRRMVVIGFSIMGAGFLLFSQVHTLWQFYGVFLMISLGSALGGFLPLVSMVNNWFSRRRSLAIAGAMSGIQFGGFLVPVLVLGLESHGFRWTTFGIGVFLLVAMLVLQRFIRATPESCGLRPDGDPPSAAGEGATEGDGWGRRGEEPQFTAMQALKTRAFWIISLAHISALIPIGALQIHLVPKLTDMGASLGTASLVILAYTAIAVPTQFLSGYIGDRIPKLQVAIFGFMLLQAASIFVLAIADSIAVGFLFAVLYGISFGGRGPLLTAIRAQYFGRRFFATIMGLSQFPSNLFLMGAPLFAGYMFDRTGSYAVPLVAFGVINFLGAWLILLAKKPTLPGVAMPAKGTAPIEVAQPLP